MSVVFKNKGLLGGVFDKLAVREASGEPSGLTRERMEGFEIEGSWGKMRSGQCASQPTNVKGHHQFGVLDCGSTV
jgi:hypothetical protein